MTEQTVDFAAMVATLTPSELQVLIYLAKGFTSLETANLLDRAFFTVVDHRKAIYRKLEVSSACEASVIAAKAGLV